MTLKKRGHERPPRVFPQSSFHRSALRGQAAPGNRAECHPHFRREKRFPTEDTSLQRICPELAGLSSGDFPKLICPCKSLAPAVQLTFSPYVIGERKLINPAFHQAGKRRTLGSASWFLLKFCPAVYTLWELYFFTHKTW